MFCSRCGTEVQVSSRFCPTCGLDLTTITQGMTASQPAAPGGGPAQPDEADIVRDALKDEYDLEKELGRGGMAIVFKARDKALEREVAIKVLPFSLSFDAEFVERFQREARTAAKLEHPNIIPIYRVGKSGRVIYFVMKFVRGKSLSALIETRGAIPVPELRRLLIECSRALGFAHRHGIVHRDIKPDNIMFDELGQAIVMDFGIAKAQSGARLTGTGMSIGTPHYMSPEQARAQNLDGRSDIYSLGVVAYQCLAGHVPFDGEDSFSIGYKHIMEELPVPPLEHADQRELFSVIQKMMAKKPDDRFQTADDCVRALETLGGTQQQLGLSDMATMQTLAMEPMKAPPRISTDKTTPLPRASGPVAKPAEAAQPATAKAAAPPPAAAPPAAKPAPPKPKPTFRPAQKPRSKAPFVALGVVALGAIALGGYMIYGRGAARQLALQPPADTTHRAPAADTTKAPGPAPASSTATTTPPADTAHHAAPPATPPRTTPTPPRTATANPPRTTPTPTHPTTTPTGTPAPAAGRTGSLAIQGAPADARFIVDGQSGGIFRVGLSVGRHELRVEANGFQPYTARIDVRAGQTTTQHVTMVPLRTATAPTPTPGAPTPGAATPQAASGAPPLECTTTPTFGVANRDHVCYNVPPASRTLLLVTPPASCPARTRGAELILKVTATGGVESASVVLGSNCQAFNEQAVAFANDLQFTPATKNGTPVVAWIRRLFRPAPRP